MPFGALLGGLDIPNAILAPSPSERKPQNPLGSPRHEEAAGRKAIGVVFSRRRRDPWCGSPSPPHRLSTVPDRRWHRVAPVRTRAAWPRLAGRSALPPLLVAIMRKSHDTLTLLHQSAGGAVPGTHAFAGVAGVASTCTQPSAPAVAPSPERPPSRARSSPRAVCRAPARERWMLGLH
jgi:hypothetical protein